MAGLDNVHFTKVFSILNAAQAPEENLLAFGISTEQRFRFCILNAAPAPGEKVLAFGSSPEPEFCFLTLANGRMDGALIIVSGDLRTASCI
jgi:hypothetical protein